MPDTPDSPPDTPLPTYTPDELSIRYVIVNDKVVAVKSLDYIVPMIPDPPGVTPLYWCFSNDPQYSPPTESLRATWADVNDPDLNPVEPYTTLLVVNIHGQVLEQWAEFIPMPQGAVVHSTLPDSVMPGGAGRQQKDSPVDDTRGGEPF